MAMKVIPSRLVGYHHLHLYKPRQDQRFKILVYLHLVDHTVKVEILEPPVNALVSQPILEVLHSAGQSVLSTVIVH